MPRRKPEGERIRAPGAGRPAFGDEPMKKRQVYMSDDDWDRLKRISNGNRSAALRWLIRHHSPELTEDHKG